nr:MAG TPA: hypothetical protein [Caudoviricetes sp.]
MLTAVPVSSYQHLIGDIFHPPYWNRHSYRLHSSAYLKSFHALPISF